MNTNKKPRKSPVLRFETVARHLGSLILEVFAQVPVSGAFDASRVHVQAGNVKTGATGEGTAAVLTCLHGNWEDWSAEGVERGIAAGVIPPCARSCYAFRQHIQYTAYRSAMVRNTVQRNLAPVAYYQVFFKAALEAAERANKARAKKGLQPVQPTLRVNESGDFETREQAQALFKVAREYPQVRVWGYTQMDPAWVMDAPSNVTIRISCWTDEERAQALEDQGFVTACVTEDLDKVSCPAQRLGKGKWFCADCAHRACGCCGVAKRVYFLKH